MLSLLFNLPVCGFLLGFGSPDGFADVVAGGRVAVLRSGRPGPGLPGFGALARPGSAWRIRRNPRRTLAGVRRPGGQGCCQGSRRSAAR